MRESLTVLAILLILVFTAALAGPYLIDWNAQRALIERQLSDAVGAPVKVEGSIDLKLLPTPYLRLERVGLADQGGPVGVSADGLRLEIAIAPLLKGEVDFTEATLEGPRLRLTLDPDGAIVPLGASPAFSTQLRFDRITVTGGEIEIRDPATHRDFTLSGLDLHAQADALTGPFRGDGAVQFAGGRAAFRFTTGELADDRLRLKLIVDPTKSSPRADIDGTLTLATPKSRVPSFAGTTVLSGQWAPRGIDLTLPWRATAALRGDARALHADSLELRVGDEAHVLSFPGTADIDLSGAPRATASFKGRQLDIDRALAQENGLPPLVRAARLFGALMADSRLSAESIPLRLDWSIESILLGGDTVSDLTGSLTFEEDRPARFSFEASGPGRAHINLDGDVETGSAAEFNGKIAARAGDLDRLAGWLAPVLPFTVPHPLPVHRIDAAGSAVISRVGVTGHDLAVRLDRSALTGTLAYTAAVGADPPRLFADVTASALDLDAIPDIGAAARATQTVDLSIRLAAQAIKIAGLGPQPVDVDRIRLDLAKAGSTLQVRALDVAGLGGANLHAIGSFDGDAAQVEATLDAEHLQNAADLLRRLAPHAISRFLARQAPALSPAHLTFSARGRLAPQDRTPSIAALVLDGALGATQLSARIAPDAQTDGVLEATARVEAPDSLTLMRQAGLSVLPLAGAGPGRITLTARGAPAGRIDASLSAILAGTSLGFAGSLAEAGQPHVAGALRLASGDVLPLLQAAAYAFPDARARLPADLAGAVGWTSAGVQVTGLSGTVAGTAVHGALRLSGDPAGRLKVDGALDVDRLALATLCELALGAPQPVASNALWSSLPFASGLADPPPTALALTAKTFDLPFGMIGHDATFKMELGPGLVALRNFSTALQPGHVVGDLVLRRDGPTAAVEGHAAIEDYPIDMPNVQGRLKAALQIAGSGRNALALVASMAGAGPAVIDDLTVAHADPGALARVFAMAETDRLAVDEAEIGRALRRELDQAPLRAGDRSFDLGLAGGQLRFTPTGPAKPDGGAAATLSATIDLRTASAEERVGLAQTALPRDWVGSPPQLALVFKGPLTAATPTVQAGAFVNALATRAIVRESARIQSYEFDVHERALFNQRLLMDRRRAQEQLKAEEDARRAAEALRVKKAEEAREKADEVRRAAEPKPLPGASGPARAPPPAAAAPDPSAAGRY